MLFRSLPPESSLNAVWDEKLSLCYGLLQCQCGSKPGVKVHATLQQENQERLLGKVSASHCCLRACPPRTSTSLTSLISAGVAVSRKNKHFILHVNIALNFKHFTQTLTPDSVSLFTGGIHVYMHHDCTLSWTMYQVDNLC